ncbi:MAG: hypothetical protein IJ145_05465 [Prevotella sp.]|nr:hypothetical protein [Prevotella sp.]
MMNRNIFISKKSYVAPLVTFEEMEEEQELLAGSSTEGTGSSMESGDNPSVDPNNPDIPAKRSGGVFDGGEGDFVFEIDGME